MKPRKRLTRLAVVVSTDRVESHSSSESLSFETAEEVEKELAVGREKARLLRWVRRHMGRRLTRRERHCLELHYFEGLTYRQIGERTGTAPSSAYRAVKRSLRKLRMAANENPPRRTHPNHLDAEKR